VTPTDSCLQCKPSQVNFEYTYKPTLWKFIECYSYNVQRTHTVYAGLLKMLAWLINYIAPYSAHEIVRNPIDRLSIRPPLDRAASVGVHDRSRVPTDSELAWGSRCATIEARPTMVNVIKHVHAVPIATDASVKANASTWAAIEHVGLHVGAGGVAAVRTHQEADGLLLADFLLPSAKVLSRESPRICRFQLFHVRLREWKTCQLHHESQSAPGAIN